MNKHGTTTGLIALMLATASMSTTAATAKRQYGKQSPIASENELPASRIKDKLSTLTYREKATAIKWLNRISFNDNDLPFLNVDVNGGVFFSDTFMPSKSGTVGGATTTTDTVQAPQNVAIAPNVFKLHSKPGATKVIYLDFDGDTITNTAWNSGAAASYSATSFDTDGMPTSFSSAELAAVQEIWHRMAEDYAPFNVDVTTELPASFGPTVGHVVITRSTDNNGQVMPYSTGSGGVAYVGVWGMSNYASYYSPAFVYYDHLSSLPNYVAEAAAHEMGHNLGLSHDGTATAGYYQGLGSGLVSWAPIMGVGYYNNVTEWSKGEYPGANNLEDDLSIINSVLSYRADDHSNTAAAATALLIDSSGVISVTNPENDPFNTTPNNKGIIETGTDVDYFTFNAGVGPLQISINPAWVAFTRASGRGANLDIQATLYDQAGTQIAQVDPSDDTNATISISVPVDGRYYLAITGVGNAVAPYSDYGSLGEYFISGSVTPSTIVNDVTDTVPPIPNPMSWSISPNAGTSTNSIAMTATAASDDSGGVVEYLFSCVSGATGCVSSTWQTSNQFTATGLAANTTYSYQVKARDPSGNETAYSAIAAATTAPIPDTIAPTPNPMTWSVSPNAVSASSISMTATTATDNSGSAVQYMFACTAGGAGCVNSAWQSSNQFTATGLAANTPYSYQVKARDASGNETAYSAVATATTPAIVDTIAPTPNPMTWSVKPTGISMTSISMTATIAKDNSGSAVQYMFVCKSGGTGCVSSAWQSSNAYTATGLVKATTYSFQVKARDAAGNQTALSVAASATTKRR